MGFFKKLGRFATKLGKTAIRAGLVPGGNLATMGIQQLARARATGASKRDLALKAQYGVAHLPKSQLASISKYAAKSPAVRAPTARLTSGVFEGARQAGIAKAQRKKAARTGFLAAAKLSQEQQLMLHKEWTDSGKPGKWEQFVIDNATGL